MATEVDICNLALSMLGTEGKITSLNPPVGGAQAGDCARWYPIALRKLLESHTWSFALRRVDLARLAVISKDVLEPSYAFALPSDCVRAVSVSHRRNGEPRDFDVELYGTTLTKCVVTDAKSCNLTYVAYVASPSLFPAYFVQPLVILLASYLYGPVRRSDSTSKASVGLLQQYEVALSQAKTMDNRMSIQRHGPRNRLADCLRVREV